MPEPAFEPVTYYLYSNQNPFLLMRIAESRYLPPRVQSGQKGYTLAAALLLGQDERIQSILPHYKTDALLLRQNLDHYDDRLYVQTNLIDAYDQL
jgi:ATP-dependent DNA helicase RecG